jgi:hypothetical protein
VRAGFFSLKYGAYADALAYWKAGQADPRAVLALFPRVVPTTADAAAVQALRRAHADTYGFDRIEETGMPARL